jgi:hypothetical protein
MFNVTLISASARGRTLIRGFSSVVEPERGLIVYQF